MGHALILLSTLFLQVNAFSNNVKVAVCSTSNERAVSTIVKELLGPDVADKMLVFAGDVVPKKKPRSSYIHLGC